MTTQFRLIDMVIATLIVGAFPLVTCHLIDDSYGRGPFLILGMVLEALAALWACTILDTWRMEAAWVRALIHLYTFLAILSFSLWVVPVGWIGMAVSVFSSNHNATMAQVFAISMNVLTVGLVFSIPGLSFSASDDSGRSLNLRQRNPSRPKLNES